MSPTSTIRQAVALQSVKSTQSAAKSLFLPSGSFTTSCIPIRPRRLFGHPHPSPCVRRPARPVRPTPADLIPNGPRPCPRARKRERALSRTEACMAEVTKLRIAGPQNDSALYWLSFLVSIAVVHYLLDQAPGKRRTQEDRALGCQ